jgi:hypothetical protein
MSLLVAALALSSSLSGTGAALVPVDQPTVAPPVSGEARPALDWLALIDAQRWDDSWQATGVLFRSQVTKSDWASKIQSVRPPLGAVIARTLQSTEPTATLPGAPDGQYAVLRFATRFVNKQSATETVILTHENDGWKVIGYFIR